MQLTCRSCVPPRSWFIDVITPTNVDSEDDLQRKDRKLADAYTEPVVDLDAGRERPLLPREITPWVHQFRILFKRTVIDSARSWSLLLTQFFQSVVVAVFSAWFQALATLISSRRPLCSDVCLSQLAPLFCTSATPSAPPFAASRCSFSALSTRASSPPLLSSIRFHASACSCCASARPAHTTRPPTTSPRRARRRSYRGSTRLCLRRVSPVNVAPACPHILAPPHLTQVTVYFLIGLQPEVHKFFIFMAFSASVSRRRCLPLTDPEIPRPPRAVVLTSTAANSLALMVSALARTTDLSVCILPLSAWPPPHPGPSAARSLSRVSVRPHRVSADAISRLVLELSRLFGGFFLSPANLPRYFVWLDALSYVKYAYVGICASLERE